MEFIRQKYLDKKIFVYYIEENMQYSSIVKNHPTDIGDFIEQKNQEIRNLKNKILGSRVTYDDMQNAKSRLDNLRLVQTQLEKEDYLELKEILKACANTINQLSLKRSNLLTKLQDEQKDGQEMETLQSELSSKKNKMQKLKNDLQEQNLKIRAKKQKKGEQILQLQEEISTRKKEVSIERAIEDQLIVASQELLTKTGKAEEELDETQNCNKKLREQIKEEMLKISQIEHNIDQTSIKSQLVQEQVSHSETKSALLHHKIEYCQEFLQALAENKLVLLHEQQTTGNIESLISMCTQSSQKKQAQERKCERQIQDLTDKIEESKKRKVQLQSLLITKKETLQELKEKGAELKSILNSIFMQDSSVLKMIADKKVFEEVDMNSTKKKNPGMSQTKNSASEYMKKDMLDAIETADNFFMTKSSSVAY